MSASPILAAMAAVTLASPSPLRSARSRWRCSTLGSVAPAFTSSWATSLCPFSVAVSSGLSPFSVRAFTFAPLAMRSSTTSRWP